MFKFIKKEERIESHEINQSDDWTKEIRRSQRIGQDVEQLSFFSDNQIYNY